MDKIRSTLETVLLSPQDRRLRAGWRVTLQGFLVLALQLCLSLPLIFLPGVLEVGPISMTVLAASAVVGALAITAAVAIARRLLDRRSFVSLGLQMDRRTLTDLLVGFGISGAQMALVFALESGLGWLHWEGWAWEIASTGSVAVGTGLALLSFVLVGYQEELWSRGYQLQNLKEGSGLPWAVVLSSLIFALLHLGNPGAGTASTIGLFVAGAYLAFAWIRTRQLWLSIGLHIGWNFFEGTVFGFAVSGLDLTPLARHTVFGPAWATGGAFGPEAGLIVLPAYVLGVALILLYTRRRRTAPPPETAS
jgi:membrane protease YdiL (CAAX protease family)